MGNGVEMGKKSKESTQLELCDLNSKKIKKPKQKNLGSILKCQISAIFRVINY